TLAERDDVRAGAVVLDAVAGQAADELPLFGFDRFRLKDRLVRVRLLLVLQLLLEREAIQSRPQPDARGRAGLEHVRAGRDSDGLGLAVARLPQRQRADDRARVV